MPRLDRATARALVESGEMPVSQYIDMFEPRMLLEVASSDTTSDEKRKKMEWLLSTTFNVK
jgi:hypothetical protein